MAEISTIADLTLDPKNARRRGPRATGMLEASLQEVGAARSIVIDEGGRILAGNGTVEAAGQVGIERVKVVDADGEELVAVRRRGLTEAQKRRLAVLDNRTGELAEWDTEVLAELAADGLKLDDLWAQDELDALLAGVNGPAPLLTDPDAIPEDVETRCKAGDLWRLGEHRLLCGDSTNREDVERLMGGEKADLVWADPPYGIDIVRTSGLLSGRAPGKTERLRRERQRGTVGVDGPFRGRQQNPNGAVIKVHRYAPVIGDETSETALVSWALLSEEFPKAVHVWWGANHYADGLPASSAWFVWDKDNPGFFADAELAWTNQTTAVRLFHHQWSGLLKESERGESRVHPTQKPVALAEWAFNRYAEAAIILDPFVGSGMSLIAAERLARTWRGLELSPEYCDVILARWEQATGKTAERIDG